MSDIENIVMGRVYRIHTLRKYINRTTVKLYGAGILFGLLASMVSVANIFENMPSLLAPGSFVRFLITAALNTELLVQVVLMSIAVVTILAIYDIAKNTLENKATFANV